MSFSGGPSSRYAGFGRAVGAIEDRSLRPPAAMPDIARWKWLEELRFRFDLAIEILDANLSHVLSPLPDRPGAPDLRAAFNLDDPAVRDVAAAALRSAKAQALTSAGVRIHMVPLIVRSATPLGPIGVLVVAHRGSAAAVEPGTTALQEIDQRLDVTGQWLAAAIEAELDATRDENAAARAAQRFAGVVDVIEALHRMNDEREIVSLIMEALTLWFDADVRVYHQNLSGAFVLHACLPGVAQEGVAPQLDGSQIWEREEVFRLESARDMDALGWVGPSPDTLFAPLVIEHTPDWLLTMSGASDPGAEATLAVLARLAGRLLTELHREAAERLRRDLGTIVALGHAPFDATARLALEAVARDTGAASGTMTVYSDGETVPTLSVAWNTMAGDVAPFVEAGSSVTTDDALAIGTAAGAGVTLVLALRGTGPPFTVSSVRLARSAAAALGIWFSGALLRRGDVRVPSPSEYAAGFVGRLSGHIDQLGRLNVGGAVAVVMPNVPSPAGALLDEVMQVVQEQVRASDVIGFVEPGGAGILLPDATREVASAVVGRLVQAAHRQGMPAARVGVAMFAPSSESPETLLARALMDARRRSSLS